MVPATIEFLWKRRRTQTVHGEYFEADHDHGSVDCHDSVHDHLFVHVHHHVPS